VSDKQTSGYDNTLSWIGLAIIFALLLWLLWYHQGQNIRNGVRWVRYAEMSVSQVFLGSDYVVHVNGEPIAKLSEIKDLAKTTETSELNTRIMNIVALGAIYPLRYIFTFIIILMAFWALFRGPKALYRSKLDLNHLIKRQANNFPAISPFVKFNPTNQPPRPPGAPVPAELPLFAEALGPEEWIAYYDIPVPNGEIDEVAAARAFTKQLGTPWRGTMHLAPYRQVLLAAFCLKSVRKRGDADEMLGALSKSWTFENGLKLDSSLVSQARKILRNRDISGKILSKCNQHAYENTVMVRALATAREEGGVLAPAQFLWLRAYDRLLWYPLNNLGRQSHHMEAIGAICHYKAEKMAQRPIPRPKMEDAVKVISEYMASSNARPIPALDYSKSKKRAIKKVKN
jgi:intracellular multiplication protein IcmP